MADPAQVTTCAKHTHNNTELNAAPTQVNIDDTHTEY